MSPQFRYIILLIQTNQLPLLTDQIHKKVDTFLPGLENLSKTLAGTESPDLCRKAGWPEGVLWVTAKINEVEISRFHGTGHDHNMLFWKQF